MVRKIFEDEFYRDQPEKNFDESVKEYKTAKIFFNGNGEGVKFDGVFLNEGDFSGDYYLETVFDDFKNFADFNGISGNKLSVKLVKNENFDKEHFRVSVDREGIILIAGEREGIRRAVIYLEDKVVSCGGYLTYGETEKKILIKDRITRCFFSPINRPPKNAEELSDDIDYYPEGYLNRLMHDGANGIWIVSDYPSLIKSAYITEFGEGSEKRIAKLNRVINKCKRYGIKVYLFLIEPLSLLEQHTLNKFPELYKKYPQVLGNNAGGPQAFCTFSEFGEKYLSDAVEKLFIQSPELAGIISITHGERVTSCANTYPDVDGNWSNDCPYCKDKTQSEIVAHTVDIIVKSMKKVNPDAEFISWTYGHRGVPRETVREYIEKVSGDAISMQNFEDDGRVIQLGKKRFALDYFLCYPGPSEMFEFTAENARKYGKRLFAKMQICCSHELATVPYIPVPGLVYDKMTRAKELGVTGVMESWFFGNYPCFMSKAVELLSYNEDFKDKKEFLRCLASLYFDKRQVNGVVSAWEYFEKAYGNYPVNVTFNYYGPMHDGVVWDLALKPKNFSLPRTWQLQDKPDGDRIGECLYSGHTIDECIILCEKIKDNWNKGLNILRKTVNPDCQLSVIAETLGILFDSGTNIIRFYKLRNDLGYGRKDVFEILSDMRNIVEEEIVNSEKMIPLCLKDNTVGYHSEAEGYKFFPKKLKKRIENLKILLATEFVEVEKRLRDGLSPLEYFNGVEDGIKRYIAGRNGLKTAPWEVFDGGKSKFRINITESETEIEIVSDYKTDYFAGFEFELMYPQSPYAFWGNGRVSLHYVAKSHQSVLDEKYDEYVKKWKSEVIDDENATHIIVRAKHKDSGFMGTPFKMMFNTFGGGRWCSGENPVRTLGRFSAPDDYGWII